MGERRGLDQRLDRLEREAVIALREGRTWIEKAKRRFTLLTSLVAVLLLAALVLVILSLVKWIFVGTGPLF